MSVDTITNFITPTKTIIDFFVQRIDSISDFHNNVRVFEGQSLNLLFHFIDEIQPPAAIVQYTTTEYGNAPRAKHIVKVYCSVRNFFDKYNAQTLGLDYADRIISVMDHEICNNHALCRAVSRRWVDTWGEPTDGLTTYEITFAVEDY